MRKYMCIVRNTCTIATVEPERVVGKALVNLVIVHQYVKVFLFKHCILSLH